MTSKALNCVMSEGGLSREREQREGKLRCVHMEDIQCVSTSEA
jgi:hypothetical protein